MALEIGWTLGEYCVCGGRLVAVRHDLVAVSAQLVAVRHHLVAVIGHLVAVRHDLLAYHIIFINVYLREGAQDVKDFIEQVIVVQGARLQQEMRDRWDQEGACA